MTTAAPDVDLNELNRRYILAMESALPTLDPHRRANLEVLLAHMRAEMYDLDVDAVMATFGPEPSFIYYGTDQAPIIGYDAIRAYYVEAFKFGVGRVACDFERLTVGDDTIIVEGYNVLGSKYVEKMLPELGDGDAEGASKVLRRRCASFFPFVDGKLTGEYFYLV